jgi:addiction module HigA family antidote
MPKYKRQIPPTPPGEILKEEFMVPMGLSANALANILHVPSGRITQIINAQRAISADTALRLAKAFGTSPEFWLNLQALYELQLVEYQGYDIDDVKPIDQSKGAAYLSKTKTEKKARVSTRA